MDDDESKALVGYQLGALLDTLSVDELGDLVSALKAEIGRVEAEIARKISDKSAAESLFRN